MPYQFLWVNRFPATLIESESLLVEVSIQVNGVYAYVGSLNRPFQKAPEILNAICMHVTADKFDRVINGFVGIGVGQTEIRFQRVGVHVRIGFDRSTDLGS